MPFPHSAQQTTSPAGKIIRLKGHLLQPSHRVTSRDTRRPCGAQIPFVAGEFIASTHPKGDTPCSPF